MIDQFFSDGRLLAIGCGTPGNWIDTSFFFGSSFFGSAGLVSGTGMTAGAAVAGAAITPALGAHPLQDTDAATCGAAHASQLREPWNRARNRASNPTRSHGSAQLVVNPVNTGFPHDGVHGVGAHGAEAGAQVSAQPDRAGRSEASRARRRANNPTRSHGSHDGIGWHTAGGEAQVIPPPHPDVVTATTGAATGAAGAGSAPIIRAEPRIRKDAFTRIDLHER